MQLDENGFIISGKQVQLKPYVDRPLIQREFMSDTEILSNAGSDLFVDTESYPNFFLNGFKHRSGKFIKLECGQDRRFNPQFLSWLMYNYRTISFNGIKYDLPMIWASFVCQNTEWLKQVSNELILSGKRTRDIEKELGFKVYPTAHIDLIEVAPLKGSLKLYGARMHVKRLQDLPFPDTQRLTEHEIEIVTNYNFNDLDVTESLCDFMKERLELRTAMSLRYGEDLMSKSDAQMGEVVIAKEVAKINRRFPKRPTIAPGTTYKYEPPEYIRFATPALQSLLKNICKADFVVQENGRIELPPELDVDIPIGKSVYRLGIGGLHSSEKSVSYRSDENHLLVDRDVASYYPNLITSLFLCPIAMGPAFQTVFRSFIAERLEAKKNKIFTTDKGLKIFINGSSGKLSDVYSSMYSPENTIRMTVTGQLDLIMQIEMVECAGIRAISANTDGVVYYCPKNKYSELNHWIAEWERITGFVTEETLYSGYFARDVNAYFAVKKDAKTLKDVKVKGPYSEVGSQSGTQLDTNPINLICSDAIKQLLIDGTPIEKTILECKDFTRFITVRNVKGGAHKDGKYLGKVVRWYYAKNTLGTINYVLTGNKVAETDGAKPIMDLPNEFPSDIDYDKYVAITIEMLYDINYLKRPKQITFF